MMRDIRFFVAILLISKRVVEGRTLPLPFLRGGSTATTTATRQKRQKKQRKKGHPIIPLIANNLKQNISKFGNKIQQDKKNINLEWTKLHSNSRIFIANIPKIRLPKRRNNLKSCKKLDDVCHTFSSVLRSGNEVDTAQLLKACRAHLAFMKTGGSSLRLVAKDLEANVKKAEKVYKKLPAAQGKRLSSLLTSEKEAGIHNGNQLSEKSAAMGLLWIRRSLAFQLDLYDDALVRGANHPRDAAYGAYAKHLAPFHGWALRKVFPASLSQMPARHEFIAKFGGIGVEELNEEYDRVIVRKLKVLVATWDPLIRSWEEEFERLGLEDTRRV